MRTARILRVFLKIDLSICMNPKPILIDEARCRSRFPGKQRNEAKSKLIPTSSANFEFFVEYCVIMSRTAGKRGRSPAADRNGKEAADADKENDIAEPASKRARVANPLVKLELDSMFGVLDIEGTVLIAHAKFQTRLMDR